MVGRSILIVLFATIPAFGQKGQVVEKEVRFARGKSSAVVKGIVIDRLDSHIFHVRAKAGQTMNVEMTSPHPLRDAHLCVNYPLTETGNNESVCEKRQYTIKLPRDGDYEIYIEAIRDKIPYKITISVK
jgi:hypothetical protein